MIQTSLFDQPSRSVIDHIDTLSCGAGRQSACVVLMACHGRIAKPDLVLMADTGWERKKTMKYWYEVLVPAMDKAGIKHDLVYATHADGTRKNIREDTLRSVREGTRIANAPLFVDKGMQPCKHQVKGVKEERPIGTCEMHPEGKYEKGKLNRACTGEYKLEPMTKRTRQELGLKRGGHWTTKARKCTANASVGIATEESKRAKGKSGLANVTLSYPLIELGMSTADCIAMIEELGYPVPIKSACIGCCFRSLQSWAKMKRDDPEEFADAVDFDTKLRHPFGLGRLNDGRTETDYLDGRVPEGREKGSIYPAYLLPSCTPLAEAELPAIEEGASESFGGEC
jgi:hypothetical protein